MSSSAPSNNTTSHSAQGSSDVSQPLNGKKRLGAPSKFSPAQIAAIEPYLESYMALLGDDKAQNKLLQTYKVELFNLPELDGKLDSQIPEADWKKVGI